MRNPFNEEKMFTYLKGFAMGRNWPETMKALNYARKLHKGQYRKSGEPYISHPLTMACQAVAMGVNDDRIISAILLHDVVEDCGVSLNDLPVNAEIKEAVDCLTYVKPTELPEKTGDESVDSLKEKYYIDNVKQKYYNRISKNEIAAVAKVFDRCHNVSSMAGVFTKPKLYEYIEETEKFVLPLIRIVKEEYPEYQDVMFVLKYHIHSVLDSIKGTMQTFGIPEKLED